MSSIPLDRMTADVFKRTIEYWAGSSLGFDLISTEATRARKSEDVLITAALIADAPRLAEENKRLRALIVETYRGHSETCPLCAENESGCRIGRLRAALAGRDSK